MKKLFSCLLAAASFVLALTGFSACTKNGHDHAEQDEHIWLSVRNAEVLCEHLIDVLQEARATSETLSVVCTVFPLYDWVRNIVAGDDGVSVTLLQKSGSDLHNYQPTAGDIRTIYSCDIFVYVGGESDDWIGDVLPDGGNSANPAMVCIDLLEALGERALAEEEVPGAEEHNHDEASAAARPLSDLVAAAPYEDNLAAYLRELQTLDGELEEIVSSAVRTTLVFGDRFPFRYLCEDYGLSYYAAFSGCSAESEASFATILNLVHAVEENDIPCVIVLEGSNRDIANAIIANARNSALSIVQMNSLQSVTQAQIDEGMTYLSLMRENAAALEQALN